MAIRSTAKVIILHNNKILINKCVNSRGQVYFDLPGGGQNQFETIEAAAVREVLEETGYLIKIGRFAALAEEICDNEELKKTYFDYTHRLLHIFLADLVDEQKREVREMDWQQQNSLWVPFEEVDALVFRPAILNGKITSLISDEHVPYLGCTHFVSI